MAAQNLDHRALQTWDDAFRNPIPAVRQFEKNIRHDITTNRERLRSLVGGSYRDLLATAETITDMDKRMQSLVSVLAYDIGRKCNTDVLERTKSRSEALLDQAAFPKTANFALASQLSVFRACPGVIMRALRADGRLLTAAKALLISRVLYTRKLKDKPKFMGTVQAVFDRLGSIRAKLLAAIERRIASIETPETLLDAMSAYALATTSSACDILKYFHRTRAAAISNSLAKEPADPVQALKIWLQTLRDTQSIFPRQLMTALNQIKAKPLLEGSDVVEIAEFELDMHGGWLGDDIQGFVPYVRHDDLDIATARKQLSNWAPGTLELYLRDLQTSLAAVEDVVLVAKLRRECLTAWFSGSARITGVLRSDVLTGLRSTFANRLTTLVEEKCKSLSKVSAKTKTVLHKWNHEETSTYAPHLWAPEMYSIDVSHDSKQLTKSLQASLEGRSRAGDEIFSAFRAWLDDIVGIEKSIREERAVRWQDLSDEYDDEDEDEEQIYQSLSKEDPDNLTQKLSISIRGTLDAFQTSLYEILLATQGEERSGKAKFLLRLVRDFQTMLPTSYDEPFAVDLKRNLYDLVSDPVVKAVFRKEGKRVTKSLLSQSLLIRGLWSETTNLPILPSPWAFRLFRTCQTSMEEAGQDLWTRSVVSKMKGILLDKLAEKLAETRQTVEEAVPSEQGADDSDNDTSDAAASSASRDKFTQQLFDTQYLAAALATAKPKSEAAGPLHEHSQWLKPRTNLSQDDQERVSKSAIGYWKRTSLLFAFLA